MVHYEGLFFDENEINKMYQAETHHLPFKHDEIHCTFAYKPKPEDIFDDIVGEYIDIYLIGYGYNNDNSGFEIEIPDEYREYYKNFKDGVFVKPHITLSVSKKAVPHKTRKLNFVPLKEKIKIRARFGYWIKEGTDEYLSFDEQKKTI